MNRIRFVVLLLLITLVSAAGIVQAQDEVVDIGVRGVLENGQAISDVFENGATAYLYAFVGSEGDSVTISMTQEEDSDLDPFLVLLGPSGELIASDDDSGADVSLSALIDGVELPQNGTYLLLATSFVYIDNILVEIGDQEDDQEANESFDLTLDGNTAPTEMTAEESLIDLTLISAGDSIKGEYSTELPVGYYVLSGSAGDVVTISAESEDIDTILHVFSPVGDRIAVNDDDPDGGTVNSAIRELELTEDGNYLIFVTDVFFYNATDDGSKGEYTITVE